VIVKFRAWVTFRQYIPKKRNYKKRIYKQCDESRYTYDMRVYLGKDSDTATDDMTATHTTVRHLTSRVEGVGHKIFMDNFFSSPRLFDDLDRRNLPNLRAVALWSGNFLFNGRLLNWKILGTLFQVAVWHINYMIKGNDASIDPAVNAAANKEKYFCVIWDRMLYSCTYLACHIV
jgi:hypothetical protein